MTVSSFDGTGIQVYLYDKINPSTLKSILYNRIEPKFLEEVNDVGGGSFILTKDDALLVSGGISYLDLVKFKVNDKFIGGFFITSIKEVVVGEGEFASKAIQYSGSGLKSIFNRAILYPLAETTLSSSQRFFNFAVKKDAWYADSDWKLVQNHDFSGSGTTFVKGNMNRWDSQKTLGVIIVASPIFPGASSTESADSPDSNVDFSKKRGWFSEGYQTYTYTQSGALYPWWWDEKGWHEHPFFNASYDAMPSTLTEIKVAGGSVTLRKLPISFKLAESGIVVAVYGYKDLDGIWRNTPPIVVPSAFSDDIPEGNALVGYPWIDYKYQAVTNGPIISNQKHYSAFTLSAPEPAPDGWSDANNWPNNPPDWPDYQWVKWMWDRDTRVTAAPEGTVYFRNEFELIDDGVPEPRKLSLFIAADDAFIAYLDGQPILESVESNSYTKTYNTDISVNNGVHVLAVKAHVWNDTGVVPDSTKAGVICVLVEQGPWLSVAPKVIVSTGDINWYCSPYPTSPPGWTVGNLLLALLREAEFRGVALFNYLTPQFTEDRDSAGNLWDRQEWSFNIGSKYSDIIQKLEESGPDIYVSSDLQLYAYNKRGSDFSQGSQTIALQVADEVTGLSQDGVFDEMANSLLVISSEGWFEHIGTSTTSLSKYGRIEGYVSVDSSVENSVSVADNALDTSSHPKEQYVLSFIPNKSIPWVNFNVGDTVLAPTIDDPIVLSGRRVSALAVSENQENPNVVDYAVEFGEILKTKEEKFEKWLKATGEGTLGGSIASAQPFTKNLVRSPFLYSVTAVGGGTGEGEGEEEPPPGGFDENDLTSGVPGSGQGLGSSGPDQAATSEFTVPSYTKFVFGDVVVGTSSDPSSYGVLAHPSSSSYITDNTVTGNTSKVKWVGGFTEPVNIGTREVSTIKINILTLQEGSLYNSIIRITNGNPDPHTSPSLNEGSNTGVAIFTKAGGSNFTESEINNMLCSIEISESDATPADTKLFYVTRELTYVGAGTGGGGGETPPPVVLPPAVPNGSYYVQPLIWWTSDTESDAQNWPNNIIVSQNEFSFNVEENLKFAQRWLWDNCDGYTFDFQPPTLKVWGISVQEIRTSPDYVNEKFIAKLLNAHAALEPSYVFPLSSNVLNYIMTPIQNMLDFYPTNVGRAMSGNQIGLSSTLRHFVGIQWNWRPSLFAGMTLGLPYTQPYLMDQRSAGWGLHSLIHELCHIFGFETVDPPDPNQTAATFLPHKTSVDPNYYLMGPNVVPIVYIVPLDAEEKRRLKLSPWLTYRSTPPT